MCFLKSIRDNTKETQQKRFTACLYTEQTGQIAGQGSETNQFNHHLMIEHNFSKCCINQWLIKYAQMSANVHSALYTLNKQVKYQGKL